MGTEQFVSVTEMAGQKVSAEQLMRTCHRYYWAAPFAKGGDIAEVACGAGPGLGYMATVAKSVRGGDISPEVLERARAVYGDTFELAEFDAASMPYSDNSLDAVLLFEAIYYLPDIDAFMREVIRVLRPGGWLLIATANKDLYDFTPSPYSTRYLGARELDELCRDHGLDASLWGYLDTSKVSFRQRLLRPLKLVASRMNLIPGSMAGKVWLKKLFFGSMTEMPGSILDTPHDYHPPEAISPDMPDQRHKVLYCAARFSKD